MPDDPETIFFDPIIDALYPLPDDRETMTLGWLRRVFQDIVRLNEAAGFEGHELHGPYPTKIGYEIGERTLRVSHASWFEPLQMYLNTELGMDTTVEAIDELVRRLSKCLHKPWHQVSLMPVSEAVALLARAGTPEAGPTAPGNKTTEAPVELPDLVTLDQAAAVVNRTSAGLRHYRRKGMPEPFVQGKKGKPNEYRWSEMRPWLESAFDRVIPEVAILKFRSSGR
jgi:hypothetical protein